MLTVSGNTSIYLMKERTQHSNVIPPRTHVSAKSPAMLVIGGRKGIGGRPQKYTPDINPLNIRCNSCTTMQHLSQRVLGLILVSRKCESKINVLASDQ